MPVSMDDVKRIAPDAKSVTAAKSIAKPNHWPILGRDGDKNLWGECQGSERYAVFVQLPSLSCVCNCPSRKRPCKHALGLLILSAGGHPIADNKPTAEFIERASEERYASSWE